MDITVVAVTAHKWEQGWELHLEGEAVTQVVTLDKAERQILDYLDTIDPDIDHSGWKVSIVPQDRRLV